MVPALCYFISFYSLLIIAKTVQVLDGLTELLILRDFNWFSILLSVDPENLILWYRLPF